MGLFKSWILSEHAVWPQPILKYLTFQYVICASHDYDHFGDALNVSFFPWVISLSMTIFVGCFF